MTEIDDMDVPPPDAVGALDRFATNVGLAVLAVIPTLAIVVFTPWRVAGQLARHGGAGRIGMVLAPGAYFLFTTLLAMGVGAQVSIDPSTVAAASAGANTETPLVSMGVVIGPSEAARVVSSLQEGNAWGALFAIVPLYFMVVFAGACTSWLRVLLGDWWTMSTAVRASFYYFATSLFLAICVGVGLERYAPEEEIRNAIAATASVSFFVLVVWMYTGFFRAGASVSWVKAGGAAVLASITFFAAIAGATFLTVSV